MSILPARIAAQEELDATFIAEIDSLLREEERRQAVLSVIRSFEEKKLRQEQRFDYSFVFPMLRGAVTAAYNRDLIRHEGFVAQRSSRFGTTDYGVAALPLATAWVMKAAGVKSRSTTVRMASASAVSMALAAGIAKSFKTLSDEQRPDGSDNHSMPSGHSAVAFVSAAILAREYGDLSPWIGVGGYTAATATQYLRLRHNRHWAGDLYMGAGIGMLSTSLGYLLTDRLLVSDGIANRPEVKLRDMQRVARFNNQPSGLSVISGTEFGNRTFAAGDAEAKALASFTIGADLSCFVSQTMAVGAIVRSTAGYAKVYDRTGYTADDLVLHHFDLKAEYSYPYALGKRVGARAFGGVRHTGGMQFASAGCPTLHIASATNAEAGCGIAYEAIDRSNYAVGFACDYTHTFRTTVMPNRFSVSTTWKVIF